MKGDVQLLEAYLRDLMDIHQTGGGLKETSYYGTLEKLFNAVGKGLKPQVRGVMQLINRGAGHPDGGFFTKDQWSQSDEQKPLMGQPPARGVIEIKPIGDDAWVTSESEQVTKYWKQYQIVLVTNYRDFVLVGRDSSGKPATMESYRLAASEQDFWMQLAHPLAFAREHGEPFVEYLRRAMRHAAAIASPRDLAWFLASYARTASARIQGKDIPALKGVRSALEAALGLKFEGEKGEHFFRSTLVQTVFYGLFSAWVLWSKKRLPTAPDVFRWHDAVWELKVPVMRALFEQVVTPSHIGALELRELLDWAAATLNRVDRASFFSAFEEGHAVQYFYEPFLEAFDPELRKDLGVWYTPPEIVRYMVARVDTVLREELHIADGLADPSVFVLDPCCGTGSYLVEVLRRIHETLKTKGGDALLANDVKQAALKRVFGFEILPAPFVVAHMQMGLLLQSIGAPLSEVAHERPGVYLTNALTGWEPMDPEKEKAFQSMLTGFPQLLEEQADARTVKQQAPILVILGNPPYNAFAGTATTQEERDSVAPYKEGLVKKWKIKKFNLDDLYVRFFRMAERRIAEQTGRGVVCFISNFSYLSDPSFVVMRQRFLGEFDRLWFDNMNGDSRETGKRTPDGKPDPSVFSTEYNKAGIRVGTAVALLARNAGKVEKPTVRYREFWGASKRAEILETIASPSLDGQYQLTGPSGENRYSFRPSTVSAEYLTWLSLDDLTNFKPTLGILENRKEALIDIDKHVIEDRMKLYYDPNTTWEDLAALRTGLTEDAARYAARRTREIVLSAESYNPNAIRKTLARPMDYRWCYSSSIRPLWNEPRPNYSSQCWNGNAFIVTRRNGVADPEGVPFFYTVNIGVQHSMQTDAYYIPIRLRNVTNNLNNKPKEQAHLMQPEEDESKNTANLSSLARSYLSSLGIDNPDSNARIAGFIWMHALAIGYSPAYLTDNADGIRKDWPRVPLPATKELLEASAALGEKVAALLDTEKKLAGITESPVRPELQNVATITRDGGQPLNLPEDLAVSAGWGHRGQNQVVMPGRGKAVERDYTPQEKQSIVAGAGKLGIAPEQAFDLLGDRTLDIYLNDDAYWKNVPVKVWAYIIGGYQVMKKWLSYREEDLLGRPLTADEAREVTNMARRIAAIILLQPALDENYTQCKTNTYKWPGEG